jgi:Glycosyl hydrolases family 43
MLRKAKTILAILLISIVAVECTDNYRLEPPPGTVRTVDTVYKKPTFIYPGLPWFDNERNIINAHSGGIVFENGFYYWFGTHKLNADESTGLTSGGIHCYKSANLINWDDMGIVMPLDATNPNSDISVGTRVERSKVVHNSVTGKYIAYFTIFPKGTGLTIGYTGIAVASSITGPYIYQGKFLASSTAGMGDFTMYKEPNGDLYHIGVRKTDRALVFAKMSADYLSPATAYTVCTGVVTSTEAPAIILRNGVYHLLGSGSTGWDPNAPRYYHG